MRRALEDVRGLVQYQSVELNYYSVSWTEEYKVYTAYTALYDWMNRKNGYAAMSVFVPWEKMITGGPGSLLDRLMGRYREEYVREDYKIKQVPEQSAVFFEIVSRVKLADDPKPEQIGNRRELGVVRFLPGTIGACLENVGLEEYKGYSKVFFLPAGQRRINGSPRLKEIQSKSGMTLDPTAGTAAQGARTVKQEKLIGWVPPAVQPPPAPAAAPKKSSVEEEASSTNEDTFKTAPFLQDRKKEKKTPTPVPLKPTSTPSRPAVAVEPQPTDKQFHRSLGERGKEQKKVRSIAGSPPSKVPGGRKPVSLRFWFFAGLAVLFLGVLIEAFTSGPSAAVELEAAERLEREREEAVLQAENERRENQQTETLKIKKKRTQEVILFANAEVLNQLQEYDKYLNMFNEADQLVFSSLSQRSAIKARIETMREIAGADYRSRQPTSRKEGLGNLNQLKESENINAAQRAMVTSLLEAYRKQDQEQQEKEEFAKKKAKQAELSELLKAAEKDRRRQVAEAQNKKRSSETNRLFAKINAIILYNEVTYDVLEIGVNSNAELSFGEKFTLKSRLKAMRKVKALMDRTSFGDYPAKESVQKLAENPSLTKEQKKYILSLSSPKK